MWGTDHSAVDAGPLSPEPTVTLSDCLGIDKVKEESLLDRGNTEGRQ